MSICFGALIVAILYRIFVISFVEGNSWRELSKTQERPNISVSAARGNIYSCDNQLMATTEYRYRMYMDFWAEGFKPDTLKKYIDDLSVNLNRMLPQRSVQQHKTHLLKGLDRKQKEADLIKAGKKTTKNIGR